MGSLTAVGRIFYGIALAGIGFLTIYYKDFPYIVIPPHPSSMPGLTVIAYISGALFVLAGVCIVIAKSARLVCLFLGAILLLNFAFYFIPYQLLASANYMHFSDWENAVKELTLASGAFVIAGCFPKETGNSIFGFFSKLIPLGTMLFAITIISYSMDHFLYANAAADYVPSWISHRVFWIYFAGIALLGSGLAILLKIRTRLMASLLGMMIFIWFIILHIPYVIASSTSDRAGETASAFLALAYSGIAFVIAGQAKKKVNRSNT